MFRDGTSLDIQSVNVLLNAGGLGDNIARLPALKYLRDHCQHINPLVYVPDYFYDLAVWCLPDMDIKKFSDATNYNDLLPAVSTTDGAHSSLKTHLVDFTFHLVVDKQVEIVHKNYLQPDVSAIDISSFKLPDKYVVITTGHTVAVREFLPASVNEVAKYVISKGYTPVFLGNTKAKTGSHEDIEGKFNGEVDLSVGINLVNKTSLLEALKIISGSKAFVGVDNGLAHLAGMTQVPIVCGYTTVAPEYRVPYRNNKLGWNTFAVIPNKDLACKFCQSSWNLFYNFDFRNCYYKDNKCVSQMTSNKFVQFLEKLL